METSALHPALGLFIFHEVFPHESRAVIFRHQHGDAEIDAKHICVIPFCERIESACKAVFLPDPIPVAATQISQNSHADVEEKRKGASCRASANASLDGRLRRRA